MAFIQAVTLLFGDPVVSFVVVAAGFLFFSGAGGGLSQRLEKGAMHPSLWAMAALGLLGFFTLDAVLQQVLNLGPALRAAAAAALLLPAGLPAGLPFPLGMRLFLDAPSQRAFAWGANGTASVLTAVAAVQAAIGFGISANLLLGGASYLLASFCFKKAQKAKSAA